MIVFSSINGQLLGIPVSQTFTLPNGNPKDKNNVEVMVVVKDTYGAKSPQIITKVQVIFCHLTCNFYYQCTHKITR